MALSYVSPQKIDEIGGVLPGTSVQFEGVVSSDRILGDLHILKVDNVSVSCHCSGFYQGKNVRGLGVVESFNDKIQIKAHSLEILD